MSSRVSFAAIGDGTRGSLAAHDGWGPGEGAISINRPNCDRNCGGRSDYKGYPSGCAFFLKLGGASLKANSGHSVWYLY